MPYNPYLSKQYDAFICHCGDDSKASVALPLRTQLQEQHSLSAFVDETELQYGGDARRNMAEALKGCQVAVVIFSPGFWDSASCVNELVDTVSLAEKQQTAYLPVFMYSTHDEVRKAALDARGKKFAEQVCQRTGVRHKGETLNGRDKLAHETINDVCAALADMLQLRPPNAPLPVEPSSVASHIRTAPELADEAVLESVPPRDPRFRHLGEPDPAAGPGAGRPDLAASTLDALLASPRARVLLWGMPGVGKTALARHIANLDHPQRGDAAGGGWRDVLWITWGRSCTGAAVDAKAKRLLQQCAPAGTVPAKDLAACVGGRDMLVVMDDVWDARIPQLLAHADCRLLVTAHRRDVLPCVHVEKQIRLSPEEVMHHRLAAAVLDSYYPLPADEPREPSADFISQACGHHPGLLSGAAQHLHSSPGPVKPPWAGILSDIESCTGFTQAREYARSLQHTISLMDMADRQLLCTWQLFQAVGTRRQPLVIPLEALREGFATAVGRLVSHSVLLEGVLRGLWAHPVARTAIGLEGDIQAPLVRGLPSDCLTVLLWYGHDSAFKASAAALDLSAGASTFVHSVRERLTTSLSLHRLWSSPPRKQAVHLLSHLACQQADALRELCSKYIRRRSDPWHQAVCVAVLRAVCEGQDAPLRLESVIKLDRAVEKLLSFVDQGLDAGPLWLREHICAGADVLYVLRYCLATAGSSGVQPARADNAESIYGSCLSSLPVSLPMEQQSRPGLGSSAEEACAAEAAADAGRQAVAARAASRQLVVENGGAALLIQLLDYEQAQCSTLKCIKVLACSPDSSAAIALEDNAPEAFTVCLRSDNQDVQLAALNALAALEGQLAALEEQEELDSLIAALTDLFQSPRQDVSTMATHVLNACGAVEDPNKTEPYDVCITCCPPECKDFAALLKARLQEQDNLRVILDITDLPIGSAELRNMQQARSHCKVAIVLFSPGFWGSASLCEALQLFVMLAEDQHIAYLPVFMYSTPGEVRTAAMRYCTEDFAEQVCKTPVRYKGALRHTTLKSEDDTCNEICAAIKQIMRTRS